MVETLSVKESEFTHSSFLQCIVPKISWKLLGRDDENVTFKIVNNDGTDDASEDLITLKNIFSRQLPKMPKGRNMIFFLDI